MKGITNGTSGACINAPGPREGCLRLQTMAHVLFHLCLQRVITRTRYPHQALDLPKRPINRVSLRGGGPNISFWNVDVGQGNVHVFDTKWLMYAARAGVADHYRDAFSDLPLHVQVPFHHVIARGVGLYVIDAQRLGITGTDFGLESIREVSLR